MRNIHIGIADVKIWQYQIHDSGIKFKSPAGKSFYVQMTDFMTQATGRKWTWDDIERAHWKKCWPQIGPSNVKNYIEQRLIEHA